MPISRDLYTSNFASFKKGVSHGNADRIAQKKSEHSIYIHGAPETIAFPNQRTTRRNAK